VLVRPLSSADLGQVSDIFGWYATHSLATFEEAPRTQAEWTRLTDELAALNLPFLVADQDGEVVGYAYAGPWRRKPAYRATAEDSVFIAAGRTGQGIGRLLLTELLAACTTAGLRQLIAVIADADAAASIRLHESFGFALAGRLTQVGFKHGRWIDTILMQRTLSDTASRPVHPD
jgi:L-amino acid N-acyltransferase YncA